MTINNIQSVGALHGALTYVNNSFDTEPRVRQHLFSTKKHPYLKYIKPVMEAKANA